MASSPETALDSAPSERERFDPKRIGQLFARLVFRERSIAVALEKPETLSIKMLASHAGVVSMRALLEVEAQLERESASFTPPALWLAWFEHVHRETAERLEREIAELPLAEVAVTSSFEGFRGCIYVSYAREDEVIAEFVVRQLKEAGLSVWFDKQALQPGEDWTKAGAEVITKWCGAFLSLISVNTARREIGNFFQERRLAAERMASLPSNTRFYFPVRIDEGQPIIPPNEPPVSLSLHAARALGGDLEAKFVEILRETQLAARLHKDRPTAAKPSDSAMAQ